MIPSPHWLPLAGAAGCIPSIGWEVPPLQVLRATLAAHGLGGLVVKSAGLQWLVLGGGGGTWDLQMTFLGLLALAVCFAEHLASQPLQESKTKTSPFPSQASKKPVPPVPPVPPPVPKAVPKAKRLGKVRRVRPLGFKQLPIIPSLQLQGQDLATQSKTLRRPPRPPAAKVAPGQSACSDCPSTNETGSIGCCPSDSERWPLNRGFSPGRLEGRSAESSCGGCVVVGGLGVWLWVNINQQ
eukprot:Skav209154  [mRNA]  locus=scaffold1137:119997:131762:- [translate_table: standard]